MNKKERFCDVDNIVEWRHIITILLALVAMAGQGQVRCLNLSNKFDKEMALTNNLLVNLDELEAIRPSQHAALKQTLSKALNSAQILQMIQAEYPNVKSDRSTMIHLGLAMKELGIDHLLYNNKRVYKVVPLKSA